MYFAITSVGSVYYADSVLELCTVLNLKYDADSGHIRCFALVSTMSYSNEFTASEAITDFVLHYADQFGITVYRGDKC